MLIDLTRLNNRIDSEVIIDESCSFNSEELSGTGVTSIEEVSVTGNITLNAIDNIVLYLDIDGTMIIPCAITLKPVDYQFSISINEDLSEINGDEDGIYQNSLDILPIIWENILMEIPMRVISEGAESTELSGEGWKLIREDEKKENSELSKLKDLL